MRRHVFRLGLIASLVVAGAVAACSDSPTNTDAGVDSGDQPDTTVPDTGVKDTGGSDAQADADDGEAGDPNCSATPCITQVALGSSHACAVAKDGALSCWGLNANGQLGSGAGAGDGGGFNPSSKNIPKPVTLSGPVQMVTCGFFHTCALLTNGEVWCWGDNKDGQLGLPADGGSPAPNPTPQKVTISGTVSKIEAGGFHTCAQMSTGDVVCWGLNINGQVSGSTSPIYQPTPTALAGLTGVSDIGLGDQFTCGITGGSVSCVGSNYYGQLGRNKDASTTELPFSATVAPVTGVAGSPTEVGKANGGHQCIVTAGGIQCWGKNYTGEQGGGPGELNYTATNVAGISGADTVAPGFTHTCVLLKTGDVMCFGGNNNGQAGVKMTDGGPIYAATLVNGIANALQLQAGWGDFSCAVIKGGSVKCWGANYQGQLGRGGITKQFDEVPGLVTF